MAESGKEGVQKVGDLEKTVEEYDREINEKTKKLHPELFENIE